MSAKSFKIKLKELVKIKTTGMKVKAIVAYLFASKLITETLLAFHLSDYMLSKKF